jgi:uncharacterized protein YegL
MNGVWEQESRKSIVDKGLKEFLDTVQNRYQYVDTAIVGFGDSGRVLKKFDSDLIEYEAEGLTNLGSGLNLSFDILKNKIDEYKRREIEIYRPIFVIISDGGKVHYPKELNIARKRMKTEWNRAYRFVCLVGNNKANIDILTGFSSDGKILNTIDAKQFLKFIKIITESAERVSTDGSIPNIDITGIPILEDSRY